MTADGENGKHMSKNNGPNPCFSNQLVTFFTCLFFRTATNIRLSPRFLTIKKTNMAPKLEPAQDNKNPSSKPYAAALAITKTTNGKKGRNASINGNKIPGNGPNFS